VSSRAIFSIAFISLATAAAAQDHVHAAPQGEKLGTVHFPTSCSSAAQPQFDRAVTLLHSFEFGAAIKGFESVLAADPTCAMAHWGIAMSRWSNPVAAGNRPADQLLRGSASVNSAVLASSHATDRERAYIGAVAQLYKDYATTSQGDRVLAYERAMSDLVMKAPADTEAKIFYAISLVASAPPTDKSYANQRKAGSILEPLWAKQPNHPGLAHYLIHTYNYPALAREGAAAAREYSVIAPSAAHALHMPSHIFTRTGMWRESIEANRRSMGVALSTASIAETLHAADYSAYAYLQLRRDSAAKSIVDQLPALAARFDPKAITGAAPGSAGVFALAAIPARYALERQSWSEAAALVPKHSDFPWTEAMTYFARALGAAHTRDFTTAQRSVDSLASIRDVLAARNEPYWSEQVAIQQLGALAWLELSRGSPDSALNHMREAARREDATEKNAVTPGPLAPASELLGDMLMQLKRPREALAEYQKTLSKEPDRYRALAGAARAAAAAGDAKTERQMKAQLKHILRSRT
jgi:tetratricopeptide (TPR) repeat protein